MSVFKASVRSLLPVGGKSGGTVPAPSEGGVFSAPAPVPGLSLPSPGTGRPRGFTFKRLEPVSE